MNKHNDIILLHTISILLFVLCFSILVGTLYGSTWAGGSGTPTHYTITDESHELSQSQTVSSGNEYKKIVFSDGSSSIVNLYLAKNTSVTLVNTTTNQPQIRMLEGRLVVQANSPITIHVDEFSKSVLGTEGYTFYSWKSLIEYFSLEQNSAHTITSRAPFLTQATVFSPTDSVEQDFYTWTGIGYNSK